MVLGVGGDYPISATLMSEYAPARSRGGLFVAGVFSMQGWGIVTAALLGLGLLNAKVNPDLAWRIILGLGAAMPALVIYFRRRVHETPRFEYFVRGGNVEGAKRAIRDVLKQDVEINGVKNHNNGFRSNFIRYLPVVLGTAIPWFALDVFFYGMNIFGPFITSAMGLAKSHWRAYTFSYMLFWHS